MISSSVPTDGPGLMVYFQKRTLRGAADAAALAAAQDLASRTCNSASDPCYHALRTTVSNSTGKYSYENAGVASSAGLPACTGGADLNCYRWPYVDASGSQDWNRVAW